jgi:hypothetical protein
VINLETGAITELGRGQDAAYSTSGYLFHSSSLEPEAGVWLRPFSLETLETTGESMPIDLVGRRPSLSRDGTLAFEDHPGASIILVWRNRQGEVLETVGERNSYLNAPALSPEGDRIVVLTSMGDYDLSVYDLARSTSTRLTFSAGAELGPVWSPNGREIAYQSAGQLLLKAADGSNNPRMLIESASVQPDWSHDGRYMIYGVRRGPDNGGDLLYVEISPNGEAGEAQNFAATDADESSGRFAPDGRFVAYVSNESGRSEVYVRSFPDGAGKWQVSSNGGAFPRWRRDGSELYYVDGTTLMAVPVSPGQGFVAGTPQALFNTPLLASVVSPGTLYDVSADGQRFLTWASLQSLGEAPPIRVHVVENWYEEFRDRER